jgi:hypothetical protein
MEAVGSYEVFISVYKNTGHNIPEERYPYAYRRENLKLQEHNTFHTNTGSAQYVEYIPLMTKYIN